MALNIDSSDSSKFSMNRFTDGLPENKVEVLMFGGRFMINNPELVDFYKNGREIRVSQEVIRGHIRSGQLTILDSSTMTEETKIFLGYAEN